MIRIVDKNGDGRISYSEFRYIHLLEAQLLYNQIGVTDSLTHKRLAFSSISSLFMDRFGRSLRFPPRIL